MYAIIWLSLHTKHNIHNILRYTRNENLKLKYLSQHQMRLINYFCNLQKGIYWVKGQCGNYNKIHLSSFYFFTFLDDKVLVLYFETEKTYWSKITLVPLVCEAYLTCFYVLCRHVTPQNYGCSSCVCSLLAMFFCALSACNSVRM